MINQPVSLVTGGNSGVGLMTALGLARRGYHVFIACRSAAKAAKAIAYIRQQSGNQNVEFLPLDLASLASVRRCVQEFEQRSLPLHVLINNAGIFHKRGTTQEGFERIWGTNYLGHFLLTQLLLDKLQQSEPSRIVMVASDLALRPQGIPWHLLVEKTPLNFLELYAVSKFCLLLFTLELARELKPTQVTVNAVHPGFVRSNITLGHQLSRLLGLGLSPEEGAYSSLFCATSPEMLGRSGQFLDSKAQPFSLPDVAQDRQLAQTLMQKSLLWTGCNSALPTAINPQKYQHILGIHNLDLTAAEITKITQEIFTKVLPKSPQNLTNPLKLLRQGRVGSASLAAIQLWKREFYMERHLDSDAVWRLCQDKKLLEVLRNHLGEDIILWRSELWANYPGQKLIPLWHQDSYPKLIAQNSKTVHVYIALTEVTALNGFEFLDINSDRDSVKIQATDPFSGSPFFEVPTELADQAIPVVLKPGQFIIFSDQLIHRSVRNLSGKVRLSLTLRIARADAKITPGYSPKSSKPVAL